MHTNTFWTTSVCVNPEHMEPSRGCREILLLLLSLSFGGSGRKTYDVGLYLIYYQRERSIISLTEANWLSVVINTAWAGIVNDTLFLRRTRWNFVHWPPSSSARKRAVLVLSVSGTNKNRLVSARENYVFVCVAASFVIAVSQLSYYVFMSRLVYTQTIQQYCRWTAAAGNDASFHGTNINASFEGGYLFINFFPGNLPALFVWVPWSSTLQTPY